MFLYEKMDTIEEMGDYKDIPLYIPSNLNPKFELRPYQEKAFRNFITFFESKSVPHPTQVLFHAATGSGKTIIMAGLILYLYKKGYRNFLFFVHLSNIIVKTKENFKNITSKKYLFSDEIVIDGEKVKLQEVDNFEDSDPDKINICFTTIQGLHTDLHFPKENGMSMEAFDNLKVVFISDESHHLNVSTRRLSKEEEEDFNSWEYTVKNIFSRNPENVLLEFTATLDLQDPVIKAEYENKIIFDYTLQKFYADGYSKDIRTIRTDLSLMDRALQALILSQYRLKVFQDNKQSVKPVILFKSQYVNKGTHGDHYTSDDFLYDFSDYLSKLHGAEIGRLKGLTTSEPVKKAFQYFADNGISDDMLAEELKQDFSPEHCLSANNEKQVGDNQINLNSLEDSSNPYRAVFAVDKLNEGWDVLNLFDIVRLYETRQSGGRSVSKVTITEAQLIGRGARYCPFKITEEQPMYQRKYDDDAENDLRICEELYYHCQNEERYIAELHKALRETGLNLDEKVKCRYTLKDSFKADELYKSGVIFINDRYKVGREDVNEILDKVRTHIYHWSSQTGASAEDEIMDNSVADGKVKTTSETKKEAVEYTIGQIADINYALVNKALRCFPIYKFDILKQYYPNLKSTREFITSSSYLKDVKIRISGIDKNPPLSALYTATKNTVEQIAEHIAGIKDTYRGYKKFEERYIHDVFYDKTIELTKVVDGGVGKSQRDITVPEEYRIDLNSEDWFAYNDNYGTSEEKAMVGHLKGIIEELQKTYKKVYLLRNEREFHIYSFDDGQRFEPDYVLFVQKEKSDGFEQIQVFIEPKGDGLLETDKWKEDFLLQLQNKEGIPVKTFKDGNDYKIWGVHFFNKNNRLKAYNDDMQQLIDNTI